MTTTGKAKVSVKIRGRGLIVYVANSQSQMKEYANRHKLNPSLESITVQKYPLRDNPEVDWLAKGRFEKI